MIEAAFCGIGGYSIHVGLEPVLFSRHNSAVFNLMNTAPATPNHPGCCGTACARIAMQKYVPHEA